MDDMKKILEAINYLNEDDDNIIGEFEDIYISLEENIDALARAIRRIPDMDMQERGRKAVLAHFQTALNNDHDWMGKNMTTLKDFIMQLEGGSEEEDYYEEVEEATLSDVLPLRELALNVFRAGPGESIKSPVQVNDDTYRFQAADGKVYTLMIDDDELTIFDDRGTVALDSNWAKDADVTAEQLWNMVWRGSR